MSWNNIIPNDALADIVEQIRKEPKQLHFDEDLFPPCFFIKEEYVTTCNEAFTWISPTGSGPSGVISKSVDHPAFAALRKHLSFHGYIEMQTSWVNGDRVKKPFYINNTYFAVGDKFYSSSAMGRYLRKKNYD